MEIIKKYITDILKPKIQADGGEVDFIAMENGILTLLLQGECSVCTISDKCFKDWLPKEIKRDINIIAEIKTIKKPPYFRDI